MVRLTRRGRTPLEEGREAEGKQGQDVDEPAVSVACAELPVPPAGDEIRVERKTTTVPARNGSLPCGHQQ